MGDVPEFAVVVVMLRSLLFAGGLNRTVDGATAGMDCLDLEVDAVLVQLLSTSLKRCSGNI